MHSFAEILEQSYLALRTLTEEEHDKLKSLGIKIVGGKSRPEDTEIFDCGNLVTEIIFAKHGVDIRWVNLAYYIKIHKSLGTINLLNELPENYKDFEYIVVYSGNLFDDKGFLVPQIHLGMAYKGDCYNPLVISKIGKLSVVIHSAFNESIRAYYGYELTKLLAKVQYIRVSEVLAHLDKTKGRLSY